MLFRSGGGRERTRGREGGREKGREGFVKGREKGREGRVGEVCESCQNEWRDWWARGCVCD